MQNARQQAIQRIATPAGWRQMVTQLSNAHQRRATDAAALRDVIEQLRQAPVTRELMSGNIAETKAIRKLLTKISKDLDQPFGAVCNLPYVV